MGAGEVGQLIGRKLLQHPEYRINLLGFIDAEPRAKRSDLGDLPVLGVPEDIGEIIRREHVDRVIVAFSRDGHEEMLDLVRAIREARRARRPRAPAVRGGRRERRHPHARGPAARRAPVESDLAVFRGRSSAASTSSASATLLALVAPLMLVIAFLIRRDSQGPVFFRQTRLGMDLREFTLLKFRTMHEGTDEAPHREYIKQIMSVGCAARIEQPVQARPSTTRSRGSAAGCGRRASTSCRN